MKRILPVVVLLTAVACGTAESGASAPDLAEVRSQIDSLWTRYSAAAVAADIDGVARLYTESPYLVESGLATVRSNAELREVVKNVMGSVRFIETSIRPELTELAGDRVLQFGTYRDVMQPTGQPVQVVHGRFSAVLLRDSTSAWRVSRLIAVADSTVPQAPVAK